MPETTALGAAMAAGNAEGIGVWNLNDDVSANLTTDTFVPSIAEKGTVCLIGSVFVSAV